MRRIFELVLAGSLLAAPIAAAATRAPHPEGTGTQWTVHTSEGFDALCALNLLSGDPYYLEPYPDAAKEFAAPRYDDARRAAASLKSTIKDEQKGIISAFLTLVFSGGPDSTLAAVLVSARQPERLEAAFRASAYWSEDSWALFLRVRPRVVEALAAMQQAGFEADWKRHMGPAGEARAESLSVQLAKYDVLGEQARLLGHPLQGGRIDVVLLWYSMPHGIRIQGSRFLTNVGYPLSVVLRNAAHEPLHPPFDRNDPRVAAAIPALAQDSLIARIVRLHDPSFGYTTAEGYIEEDAVQALEQLVNERLGLAEPAAERWQASDDGMHLLAAAIYSLMRDERFASRGGRFDRWFPQAVRRGLLSPREIERRARRVVGEGAVRKWAAPTGHGADRPSGG